MTPITDPVKRQVMALAAWEKALSRRAKWLSAAGAGVAAAGVGTHLLTRILGPHATPTQIDVPAKLTELFSATAPGGPSFDSGLAVLTTLLSSGRPFLAGIAVVAFPLLALYPILSQRASAVVVSLLGLAVLGALAASGGTETAADGPHASFTRAIKEHRYEAVADDLKSVDQGSTPAGLYVLAQVSIAEGMNRMQPSANLVRELLSPTAGFTPSGKALYAIEYAAFGAPRSPASVAYLERSLARQRWVEVAAAVLGCLALVVSGAALGHLGLRFAIGRRMRRIRALLGQGFTW